ncbi:hypothetical protein B0H12DRAFT_711469 [Mycena haematopus]|nr:hypothetical protein B0H12DRAFT_711469 [Mycena haematopus]
MRTITGLTTTADLLPCLPHYLVRGGRRSPPPSDSQNCAASPSPYTSILFLVPIHGPRTPSPGLERAGRRPIPFLPSSYPPRVPSAGQGMHGVTSRFLTYIHHVSRTSHILRRSSYPWGVRDVALAFVSFVSRERGG